MAEHFLFALPCFIPFLSGSPRERNRFLSLVELDEISQLHEVGRVRLAPLRNGFPLERSTACFCSLGDQGPDVASVGPIGLLSDAGNNGDDDDYDDNNDDDSFKRRKIASTSADDGREHCDPYRSPVRARSTQSTSRALRSRSEPRTFQLTIVH